MPVLDIFQQLLQCNALKQLFFCIFPFDSGKLVAKKQFKNFLATQNQA